MPVALAVPHRCSLVQVPRLQRLPLLPLFTWIRLPAKSGNGTAVHGIDMKTFLTFLFALTALAVHAANPSFQQFDLSSFSTNGYVIRVKPGASMTNINVNVITNVTLISSNVYTTNLFATNLYTTNLYATYSYPTYSYTSNAYVTNLYVQNSYPLNMYVSNSYTTNLYAYNAYNTNLYVSNVYVTNITAKTLYVENNYSTNVYVSGSLVGDGGTLTNLHQKYDLLTWAGPTNSLALTNTYSLYSAAENCSVTSIVGNAASLAYWHTLQVSNSSASGITLYLTATGLRAANSSATNALSIGAGKIGTVSFLGLPSYTSYATGAEP